MRTKGPSNKLLGAFLGCIVGAVLFIFGDPDTGLIIMLTSLGSIGIGAAAPADVQVPKR